MRWRYNAVAAALHIEHRGNDMANAEFPRQHEGEVIVNQAIGSLCRSQADICSKAGPAARQGRIVAVDKALRVEFGRLLILVAGGAAEQRCAQGSTIRCHPVEPVKAISIRRSQARQACRGRHPLRQQRRAGQRVRSPSRCPHHGELVKVELLGQLRHIGGG